MDEDIGDLDLPEDLEDIEVIYSDDEYNPENDIEIQNNADEGMIEVENDISKYTFTKHTKSVFAIDLSPDNQYLVTGGEDDIAYVWNINTKEIFLECTGHKDSVTQASFNNDGQYLATADMSGMVQVWHINDKKLFWCNEGDDLEWLMWHPFSNVLILGCNSGDIYFWQIPQGNCKVLATHGCGTSCGKILPDGKRLIAGYQDGQIKLWDIKTSTVIWQLHQPLEAAIVSIDINSDGTLLAVAPTSQLLLVSDGRIIANLCSNKENDIEAILISSELGLIATGSLSGELCVWDLSKHILRYQAKIESSVTIMKWGRDGKVFIGSTDGAIYVCDVKNGTLLNTLTGHKNDILDIAIPKDENFIISSSDDTTVKVFEF